MNRPRRLDNGEALAWNDDVERRRREYHERRCAESALYRRAYERLRAERCRIQEQVSRNMVQIADAMYADIYQRTGNHQTAGAECQPVKTHEEVMQDRAILDSCAERVRMYGQAAVADIGSCALAAGLLALMFADPEKAKQRMYELKEEQPYLEEIKRTDAAFDREIIRMSGFEW